MKSIALVSIVVGAAFVAAACGSQDSNAAPEAKTETPTTTASAPGGAPGAAPAAVTISSPATYATLAPYLAQHCTGCHGAGRKVGAKFNLTSYDGIMKGGEDGVMVKPGDPEGSPLIGYLKGTKKPPMPMGKTPWPAADIQVISDWIKAGAKDK